MKHGKHVAVVGATGAVGREILLCLERRGWKPSEVRLLASARSAGRELPFAGGSRAVEELKPNSFRGVDVALFSAGSAISREFAPYAAQAGAVVIDNSSAFRMDEDVPLVVPEINPLDVRQAPRRIIANPNCTTIVTLMALAPLHRAFGCRQVIASSYQAVSGSGAQGIAELERQVEASVRGEALIRQVYPRQIAFNVIPQVEAFLDSGYTREEMKMQDESRKILHAPGLRVSATCVRVPVYRSHSVSITAVFEEAPDPGHAREVLAAAPGVQVMDDLAAGIYPTPLDAANGDDCLVGRIRTDLALDNAIAFWVVGDQVRKGAALNAVQIAEIL